MAMTIMTQGHWSKVKLRDTADKSDDDAIMLGLLREGVKVEIVAAKAVAATVGGPAPRLKPFSFLRWETQFFKALKTQKKTDR